MRQRAALSGIESVSRRLYGREGSYGSLEDSYIGGILLEVVEAGKMTHVMAVGIGRLGGVCVLRALKKDGEVGEAEEDKPMILKALFFRLPQRRERDV